MTEIDLSEFEKLSQRRRDCKIRTTLADLTPAKRRKVIAAIDSPKITNVGIAAWLSKEGFDVSDTAIRRHRLGGCSCARSV